MWFDIITKVCRTTAAKSQATALALTNFAADHGRQVRGGIVVAASIGDAIEMREKLM